MKGASSVALAGLLHPFMAHAQSDRPLRILVGFPAGVAVDVVSRIIAEKMREELKRTVIVENRPGAGGRLAAELLKNAPPDGNTLMIAPIVVPVLAPLVFNKLNYDPNTDFTPVGRICDFGFALAVPGDSPVKNLKEYAAWLKANPQQASFGSPAAGSLPHFFGVMIGDALGVQMVHAPFNGGAALQSAVLGNHVPAGIDVVFEWLQNAKAGKVRVLATSGATRSPVMPDVPTFKEQGYPQVVGLSWMAMYAPPKTSAEQVETFNKALNKVLGLPEIKERFLALGLEVGGGSPKDLVQTMKDDSLRWAPIVAKSGFKAD
ncbi:Bug family tripartite tricarboxylate transporter substrate binding protein [Variovorax sp. J31P179]|uniref:Bug family tripartite tricarboxylate transporter substrate binding protein n=1 Tax=Variovorax sp. J31P179 TaxID=3053508 RepID=UPI0025767D31|nr:Bug family tripartite tricarboxylate transporter substrate binding protein [Variovorax sp. J31P179]